MLLSKTPWLAPFLIRLAANTPTPFPVRLAGVRYCGYGPTSGSSAHTTHTNTYKSFRCNTKCVVTVNLVPFKRCAIFLVMLIYCFLLVRSYNIRFITPCCRLHVDWNVYCIRYFGRGAKNGLTDILTCMLTVECLFHPLFRPLP